MTFPVKCSARIDQYRPMREEHLTGVTVITLCEAQEDHAAFYDLSPATTSPRHPCGCKQISQRPVLTMWVSNTARI